MTRRWRPFLKGAALEEALAGDDAPPRNSLDYHPELLRRLKLNRARLRALTRRIFVIALVAASVALVWAQKQDIIINDTGWSIDFPRTMELTCEDGTHGVFIGTGQIKLEGCDIKPVPGKVKQ